MCTLRIAICVPQQGLHPEVIVSVIILKYAVIKMTSLHLQAFSCLIFNICLLCISLLWECVWTTGANTHVGAFWWQKRPLVHFCHWEQWELPHTVFRGYLCFPHAHGVAKILLLLITLNMLSWVWPFFVQWRIEFRKGEGEARYTQPRQTPSG